MRKLGHKPGLTDWIETGLEVERRDQYGDTFLRIDNFGDDLGNRFVILYVPAYGRGIIEKSSGADTRYEAKVEADRLWAELPERDPVIETSD